MSVALPHDLTPAALDAAMAEPDPDGLAAATRLRAAYGPELAAAALHQASLRRRGRTKFGDAASGMFFTRDGLEQATRPAVADHHAARFRAAGVRQVVDLGCGIGADSLAFLRAGLEVLAVERDPQTAAVARANLAAAGGDGAAVVRCADAEEVVAELDAAGPDPAVGVFCDPARRSSRGRLWRVSDFTPSWELVSALLAGDRVAGVKLGPALPHTLVPATAEAEWLTANGETVEVALWTGPGAHAGHFAALVLPTDRMVVDATGAGRPAPLPVGPVGRYLYEPDGAVIRAGAIPLLGEQLGAWLLDPHIAYLTGAELVTTPFAVGFEVLEVLPYDLKTLRRWLRDHAVGTLEIKKRGLDVDPADLRRRLGSHGSAAATVVLTRTATGAVALVVRR